MNGRRIGLQFLQGLSVFLTAVIGFAFVTGGGILRLGHAKIEVSALDPWMLALIAVVLGIHFGFKEKSWVLEKAQLAYQALEDAPRAAVSFLFGIILLAFFGHLARQFSFHVNAFDVSFVHPPLFNAFSNPFLKCDLCLGGALPGEHLAFSFYLLAPIVNLLRDTAFHDYWIFFLQVLFLGVSVALFSFSGILRDRKSLSFLAVAIFVSHRAFRSALVWDFREDILAFVGFSIALFSLFRGRTILYLAGALLAVLSKENMSLILPFLAIPILFSKDLGFKTSTRSILAGLTVLLGGAYAYFSFRYWMPYFNPYGAASHTISSRFSGYGATPAEVLKNILTSPTALWSLIASKLFVIKIWKYLLFLLGPVLYVAWRKPLWLIPVLPGIAMNVLSSSETQWSLQFHYDLLILPFLFFATVLALPSLNLKQRQIALLVALTLSGRWPVRVITEHWPTLSEVQDSLFLSRVNPTGMLGADLRLMPQVSQMNSLRILVTPSSPIPTDSHLLWPEFFKQQTDDLTRIPERRFVLADRFLLDLSVPWHQKLAEAAKSDSSFWLEEKSPSGRYQIVNRILPR